MQGLGTQLDPFLVATPSDLNDVRNNLTAFYKQVADIDLLYDTTNVSGLFYNAGEGWQPIIGFDGYYDGDGYSISNMTIVRNVYDMGLFADTASNSEIRNLVMEDVNMNVDRFGSVFIGGDHNGIIEACAARGGTLQTGFYGAPIASQLNGTVRNCYSTGLTVQADWYGSSLVALNNSATNVINFCYGTSFVDGGNGSAGLVTQDGGGSGTVDNSFWDTETTGYTTSKGGTGKTTAQMKALSTYNNISTIGLDTAWDIVDKSAHDGQEATAMWYIEDGVDYPRLWHEFDGPVIPSGGSESLINVAPEGSGVAHNMSGTGTELDPFLVATAQDLIDIRKFSFRGGYYFEQVADIDVTGSGYLPGRLDGIFYDGKGYDIAGISFNTSEKGTGNTGGFVDDSSNGGYKNINLIGINIIADNYSRSTGGFVGRADNNETFERIRVTGSITYISSSSISHRYGGFIGLTQSNSNQFYNCYADVDIDIQSVGSGGLYVGGFIGFLEQMKRMENCYSTGTITHVDPNYAGAFVGNHNIQRTVVDCFFSPEESGVATASSPLSNIDTEATTNIARLSKNSQDYSNRGWDISKQWDFNPATPTTWFIKHGVDYPKLSFEYDPAADNETVYGYADSIVQVLPEGYGTLGLAGYFPITNNALKWTNTGQSTAVFYLSHPSVPADFWSNITPTGGDIRVRYWDGNEEIEVPREVIGVDKVAKTGQIHFDASNSLATSANEWRIYVEKGNNVISPTHSYGSQNVWKDYEAVFHMDSNGNLEDATGNGNDATLMAGTPSIVDGKVGDALSLSGSTDIYYELPSNIILPQNEGWTVGAWLNGPNTDWIAWAGRLGTTAPHLKYRQYNNGGMGISSNDLTPYDSDFGYPAPHYTDALLMWRNDPVAGETRALENGVVVGNPLASTPMEIGTIGGFSGGGNAFKGTIDEVRVSRRVQSEDELTTQYNNQNEPETFWSVGAWEASGTQQASGGSTAEVGVASEGSGVVYTPLLLSPTDGSINVVTNPILDWQGISGYTQYQLQISTTLEFSSPIVDIYTTETQYTADLDFTTTYYWRVRGVKE